MGKIKANFIKNEKEIDDIIRGIEELVDKKGAKAIIEESISLDDFNNHVQELLQKM